MTGWFCTGEPAHRDAPDRRKPGSVPLPRKWFAKQAGQGKQPPGGTEWTKLWVRCLLHPSWQHNKGNLGCLTSPLELQAGTAGRAVVLEQSRQHRVLRAQQPRLWYSGYLPLHSHQSGVLLYNTSVPTRKGSAGAFVLQSKEHCPPQNLALSLSASTLGTQRRLHCRGEEVRSISRDSKDTDLQWGAGASS